MFLPGIDPRRMQDMLRKLGIKQEPVDAERVIIEKSDGRLVIEKPQVFRVMMQGQESWQITGEVREETKEEAEEEQVSEQDIKLVMGKTGKSREEALRALKKHGGDIASAILELSS